MPDNLKPHITVLYCGRSLAQGTHITEGWMESADSQVRYVQIPCSSKIEPLYIIKLFESGADGVLLAACPHQECQFLFGSSGAEQRVRYTQRLLDEIGIGGARLALVSRSGLSYSDIKALARGLLLSVCKLGPTPLKKVEYAA